MQGLVDSIGEEHRKERASTQMTLGGLIEKLKSLPDDAIVYGFGSPDSYRGYYSDLAFDSDGSRQSAYSLLVLCQLECMGHIFEGYKGGDYLMGENTPIWIASYGTTSGAMRIVDLVEKDGEWNPVLEEEPEFQS